MKEQGTNRDMACVRTSWFERVEEGGCLPSRVPPAHQVSPILFAPCLSDCLAMTIELLLVVMLPNSKAVEVDGEYSVGVRGVWCRCCIWLITHIKDNGPLKRKAFLTYLRYRKTMIDSLNQGKVVKHRDHLFVQKGNTIIVL